MLNVVLYRPEIPANTGNIGRTCVVAGARLHLIGPLGFSLDHRMLRRAGLGYWENLDVTVYEGWNDFLKRCGLAEDGRDERLHLLTKKARRTYAQSTYHDGDYLVFGSESTGIPEELLACAPTRCERIPMLADDASLDNRDAWAAHERSLHPDDGDDGTSPLLRQDICGNFVDPDDYRISALNLSNAAAIVLYEALRQTGFPGMA
ncbi:tRNA (cytidine(34)-2'-O)-methyltransferase [Collinsella tanakaei]|uniref:tRNA (cytidine(34)-2'-O)-methyltransferase n=1 Tax=Collinsella tanakaei TaxID=626935 RepID=UPI0025A3CDCD|nr:tRNA (cytidine(34)-2'-O)-methyltransferase [Collinsella tanakaei]MDM8302859.1 tRNA (cytidine(34)-2'-O)-methyltransferase [Collinsella tanakaei]